MGERYVFNEREVNLYNWPDHLGEFMEFVQAANYESVRRYGPIDCPVTTRVESISGEDGPVHDLEAVRSRVRGLIRQYAPEGEWEMWKAEYEALLAEVEASSNRRLAEATYEFCARVVPLD